MGVKERVEREREAKIEKEIEKHNCESQIWTRMNYGSRRRKTSVCGPFFVMNILRGVKKRHGSGCEGGGGRRNSNKKGKL